jgi:regulation of enolase protein 1 (concanavalin A-like superfamily)
MAKLTMRSLNWLGKPLIWNKDYRSLSLLVDPGTTFPGNNASILAVSEKDLVATALLSVAPAGGECGILVFQTDKSQFAAGASQQGFAVHSLAAGYPTNVHVPFSLEDKENIWMRLERKGAAFSIGYSFHGETFIPLATSHLPGAESSFSFGFYFANDAGPSFRAVCSDFLVVETK